MKIRIAFIIVSFMLVITGANGQHDKYFFQLFEGRAMLSRTGGGTWLSLSNNRAFEVVPGDMINLEGNGRGELSFPDGSIARLKNQAMITIQRHGLNMRLGYAWFIIRRSSDIFRVITPLGSCNVLGTSFDVDTDQFGKSDIRVFEGIVAVRANSDARSRQLVLQLGMKTRLADSTKVADNPGKFSLVPVLSVLNSEWSTRKFRDGTVPGKDKGLPPMRSEIPGTITGLPSSKSRDEVGKVEKIEKTGSDDINILPIVRQRSEFLEMLKKQELEKDSIIGGVLDPEFREAMRENQHNVGIGQYLKPTSTIFDADSLDREYSNLRNKLLRTQSSIRQKQQQINVLINQNILTPSHKRKISSLQSELRKLNLEHRVISNKLRDFQAKKMIFFRNR